MPLSETERAALETLTDIFSLNAREYVLTDLEALEMGLSDTLKHVDDPEVLRRRLTVLHQLANRLIDQIKKYPRAPLPFEHKEPSLGKRQHN